MKLHQLLPVIQKTKTATAKAKTALYHIIQKRDLFDGLSRTYAPRDDDGFIYPPESKSLNYKAEDIIRQFADANRELLNDCMAQDMANCRATADVEIDGVTILSGVPVTYLLFLEKQVEDIKTFIASLPAQDITEEWVYDGTRDCFVSTPKLTTKTKKIVKPVVLYEATKEHPAQVKESSEDVPEGTWTALKFTGALSPARIKQLTNKVAKLEKAIAKAREAANQVEVATHDPATPIFDYLFGDEV